MTNMLRARVRRPGGEVILQLGEDHLQALMDKAAIHFHDPSRPPTPPMPDFKPKPEGSSR